MAGKRQHTIPRFLLKGFASRMVDDEIFVWVYRNGGTGSEINIKNVSVGNNFYGNDVDEQITALEYDYAKLLDDLRSCSPGRITDTTVPTLISHLCVRTRHFRQSLQQTIEFMIGQLHEHLRKEEVIRAIIQEAAKGPDVQEQVRTELIAAGLHPEYAEAVMAFLEPMLPGLVEQQVMSQIIHGATAIIDQQMRMVIGMFPRAIREGHIGALAKNPKADQRAEDLAALCWFIVQTGIPMFLGDSPCVFETVGKRRFAPLNNGDDPVKKVILPISSDRILLGVPFSICPKLDLDFINKAIARCSHEYFISSVPLPSRSPFTGFIGKWSGVLADDEVITLVDELKETIGQPRSPT